ncbi:MAG: bifunctional histidinol-phosphatase/imidazoleglycerol-phosphate dehydratase HisB [Rikenellaceae bacterium]|nr:bifunctional histidinol-phosphatase/imidazoleglycerol-phosphate dehydratase HisB [Rikenellaceae bacterium]
MATKVIFIDRDGTIIVEPPVTEQVNTLEELQFLPHAISALRSIATLDYELVIATNQDGLGTEVYPQECFDTVQAKMMEVLAGEDVRFDDVLIDKSFPHEGLDTRKPGVGMFGKYLNNPDYDLAGSYVIGDRLTDIILARNLGTKGILICNKEKGAEMLAEAGLTESCALVTEDWWEIAELVRRSERRATITRNTRETQISITVDLDGTGESNISTGLKFFDHMLDQIAHHGGVSLQVQATGDLEVDEHHTMEDVGIALGEALRQALGNKRGIERYGFALPMDECDALVTLDLGGRIDFDWRVEFTREYVGDTPTEMFKHFFGSLCAAMQANLHIEARGENNHHLAEGVFKAFARALKAAVRQDVFNYTLPSSKGVL